MDSATSVLLWAQFAVNVLGLGGLVFWMRHQMIALRGTIAAQTTALQALEGLNRTALEVVKGVDPERWAAEVRIHKELADRKAQALIDEARQKFDQEKRSVQEKQAEFVRFISDEYRAALRLAFGLIAYIPKEVRAAAINERGVPEDLRKLCLEVAEASPDWSTPPLLQLLLDSTSVGLGEVARVVEQQERDKDSGGR